MIALGYIIKEVIKRYLVTSLLQECDDTEMAGQGSDDDLANDNLESSCLVGALTIVSSFYILINVFKS